MTVTTSTARTSDAATPSRVGAWLDRWHWIAALVSYLLLSICITFPLILHLGDAAAGPSGDGDNLWFAWLLWEYRNALFAGHDPSRTNTIFALLPSVQVLADAHFNLLVGIPLQWFASPLAAYNLLVIGGFVLSGLMVYLLAGEFVSDRIACFAAGFLYTFSTYHFARAAGHFGLMTLQWLPFCAWRFFALYRRPSRTNAVMAGLAIALVPFSDLYYLAYFLVPFGSLFVVSVLVIDRHWFTQARNLRLTGLTLLVAAAIALPVLSSFLFLDADERAVTETAAQSSTDLLGADAVTFLVPSGVNPLFGTKTQGIYAQVKTPFPPIETASFLGYVTMLCALCALIVRYRRPRTVWFWLALGLGGIILAFGPVLFVEGHRIITLPTYRLLFSWPFLSNYRAPNRLTVLPLLAFSVLSAYGIAGVADRARFGTVGRIVFRGAIFALLGVALAQQVLWAFPYPMSPVHASPLYQQIEDDHGDGLLLDLPLTISGAYQYEQAIHHKRLVNGYTPRMTPQMLASVYNVPYLAAFVPTGDGTRLNIPTDGIGPSPEGSFADALRTRGITYVVMHHTVEPESFARMRVFLVAQLGVPFYDNAAEGLTAWKVTAAAPLAMGTYRVTYGMGWLPGVGQRDGLPEQYASQDAQIGVTAPAAHAVTVSFFATPILKPMTIEVRVNGKAVKTIDYPTIGVSQAATIGGVSLNQGMNTIELHAVGGCVRPADIVASPDTRCFTVGVQQFAVSSE